MSAYASFAWWHTTLTLIVVAVAFVGMVFLMIAGDDD